MFLIQLTQVNRIRADADLDVLYASDSDSGAYDWVVATARLRTALRPSCSREERTLLGTIYVNGAIHTHAASIMNIHIDAIGGLVSNPSERETRGSRGRTAKPLHLEVGTSSLGDRHIAKRDKGQLSNRKLMDPSIGKLTGRDCDGYSCWTDVGTLKRCMDFYVGIVLGVPLQIGSASCRDGNKGICSSLCHGNPKSKSLFHTDPLRIVS